MIRNFHAKVQMWLEGDVTHIPRWRRFFVRSTQIIYASFRDLTDGHLSLQAMGLVYTTLITLVPLLAISFSVLKGFEVHNQIEPLLMNVLEGLGKEKASEVSTQIIGFVDNINVRVLGTLGLGLLVYAVIALMQKIEAAFNYIWRVGQDRTFAQRFSDYLSVLLMGPLLIFISAGISTTIRNSKIVQTLDLEQAIEPLYTDPLYDVFGILIPWLLLAIGFTFIYVYMPNTKVKISAAFIGALAAALLWKTMGYIFASFIAGSANYIAIYAAFATLIVLMIWIYASWLIILIGANIAFYVQYPRYLPISREELVLTPYLRLTLGLNIIVLIGRAYYDGQTPWTVDGLSKKLNAPVLAVQKVLNILIEGGIIAPSQGEISQYYPACPLDKTPLEDVIDTLARKGAHGWIHTDMMTILPETRKIISRIDETRRSIISNQSLSKALLSLESERDSGL